MRIIGICGAAGAGKDTIANHIVKTRLALVMRFADPLKACVCEYFGYTRKQLEELEFKETPDRRWTGPDGEPRTPRQILQLIGTEGFRAVDPDYWMKAARRRLHKLRLDGVEELVLLPDMRFLNEAEMIKAEGGEILRVLKEGGSGTDSNSHVSEQESSQIEADYTVTGVHGDIPGLLRATDRVLFGGVTG